MAHASMVDDTDPTWQPHPSLPLPLSSVDAVHTNPMRERCRPWYSADPVHSTAHRLTPSPSLANACIDALGLAHAWRRLGTRAPTIVVKLKKRVYAGYTETEGVACRRS